MNPSSICKKLIIPISFLSTGYIFYNPLMEKISHSIIEHNQNYLYRKMPKRIFLVCHGESMANLNKRLNEKIPDNRVALTDKGHEEAKILGKNIRKIIHNESIKFYVSTYLRARQTYSHILESFKNNKKLVYYDHRLREQEFGNLHYYDDKSYFSRVWVGKFYYRFLNGESGADVNLRLISFYQDLLKETEFSKEKYDNYIIIFHSIVMRLMLRFLTDMTIEDCQQLKNPLNFGFWILEKDFKNRKYFLKNQPEYYT